MRAAQRPLAFRLSHQPLDTAKHLAFHPVLRVAGPKKEPLKTLAREDVAPVDPAGMCPEQGQGNSTTRALTLARSTLHPFEATKPPGLVATLSRGGPPLRF